MAEREVKKTEDRRVKRTKKALRDCLFELLEEKTVDEITVKEITAMADINRSTFYFYYRDIDDMMIQIQDEIYSVFERDVIRPAAQFNTKEDFVNYLVRFLTFCREREKICKVLMRNDPKNNLTRRIKSALLMCIPDTTKVFAEDDPRRYLTDYAVAGFWQLILGWMFDGMKIPPNEMATFLTNVYFYGSRYVLTAQEGTKL